MIVAEEMKDAVHDQMAEMVRERLTLLDRLAHDGLEGEYDVAEQERRLGRSGRSRLPGWKREHVSRSVLPPIIAIELPLLGIVSEGDAKLDVRRREPGGIASDPFCGWTNPLPVGAMCGDIDRQDPPHHDPPARMVRSRA